MLFSEQTVAFMCLGIASWKNYVRSNHKRLISGHPHLSRRDQNDHLFQMAQIICSVVMAMTSCQGFKNLHMISIYTGGLHFSICSRSTECDKNY